MPHYITETCIGTKDAACTDVCPVDCIHPRRDEPEYGQEKMLYIDPNTCIDCGLCVDECPVAAIYSDDTLPTNQVQYVQINAAYYARP